MPFMWDTKGPAHIPAGNYSNSCPSQLQFTSVWEVLCLKWKAVFMSKTPRFGSAWSQGHRCSLKFPFYWPSWSQRDSNLPAVMYRPKGSLSGSTTAWGGSCISLSPLQDYLGDSSYPLSDLTVGKSVGLRLGNAQENGVKQERSMWIVCFILIFDLSRFQWTGKHPLKLDLHHNHILAEVLRFSESSQDRRIYSFPFKTQKWSLRIEYRSSQWIWPEFWNLRKNPQILIFLVTLNSIQQSNC